MWHYMLDFTYKVCRNDNWIKEILPQIDKNAVGEFSRRCKNGPILKQMCKIYRPQFSKAIPSKTTPRS